MTRVDTSERTEVNGELMRDLTRRVHAEYAEMPGLSVTLAQAQRLLGVDEETCADVFRALTRKRILRRTLHGRYVRARS